jgi:hypothetical protein
MLGRVETAESRLTKKLANQHFPAFKEMEANVRKLMALVMGGEPFYARINEGCRKGSIVRIDSSQYKVAEPGKIYFGQELNSILFKDKVVARLTKDYSPGKFLLSFHIPKVVLPDISYQDRIKAEFDGRKTVGLTHDEQYSMEFLPDYSGPTVYVFTKTQRTPEERAALKDPAQHKVFDQIGEEIAIGDLFFYGEANALNIGKLLKVGKTGALSYASFVGNRPTRIITETVRKCVSEGKPVPALLKFSKDLGDKLMLFKLSK